MDERTEAAVERVLRALNDPGRAPQWHRQVASRHREEWPALHRALDELQRARRGQPTS